jgi:hypothetical protein
MVENQGLTRVERYIRAREVYQAVSFLLSHPPRGKEARLKEVTIIKSQVAANQLTYEEVFLAGLSATFEEFEETLIKLAQAEETDLLEENLTGQQIVPFCTDSNGKVVATEQAPEVCSCHVTARVALNPRHHRRHHVD